MHTYDVYEAVKATGATLRQIDHLFEKELVHPKGARRRGMSRMYGLTQLRYIAVAARLMSWGVPVAEIENIIGIDKPINPGLGFTETFIDTIWEKLEDPNRARDVEVLLVFRITDPADGRILHYLAQFVPAKSLVSAARTNVGGFFIYLPAIAEQINTVVSKKGAE